MKDEITFLSTEAYNVKKGTDSDGHPSIILEGKALPFGQVSRNGFEYDTEAVKEAMRTMEGAPILFNHNTDLVLGHIEKVVNKDDGVYYRASIDKSPAVDTLKQAVRGLERGDIKNVSIGAIVKNAERIKDHVKAYIKEFVELSVVTIPGFADTSANVIEKFNLNKEANQYQNDDGTFKSMKCPDSDDESKFCGCVKYIMSDEGGKKSLESAKKICGKIAQNKQSYSESDKMVKEEAETTATPEETSKPEEKTDLEAKVNDLAKVVSDLAEKVNALSNKVDELSKKPEEEKPAEQPAEAVRKSAIVTDGGEEEKKPKTEEGYIGLMKAIQNIKNEVEE